MLNHRTSGCPLKIVILTELKESLTLLTLIKSENGLAFIPGIKVENKLAGMFKSRPTNYGTTLVHLPGSI
jgi:hypothetical protein